MTAPPAVTTTVWIVRDFDNTWNEDIEIHNQEPVWEESTDQWSRRRNGLMTVVDADDFKAIIGIVLQPGELQQLEIKEIGKRYIYSTD